MTQTFRCDFCEKGQDETSVIITSAGADICSDCVWLCVGVLLGAAKAPKAIQFPQNDINKNTSEDARQLRKGGEE
ncbi:ClpX C4-type zinc finger protein [Enterobacter asburiae]|uniref:ClpX C4-type zinc finger protein n=1 Tax=Enterobacter asburiae TaxID=61645 RepID=UPI003BF7C5E1